MDKKIFISNYGYSLRLCISNKFPVNASVPWMILWVERIRWRPAIHGIKTKYCHWSINSYMVDLLAFFNSLTSSLPTLLLNPYLLGLLSVPWRHEANFCLRVFVHSPICLKYYTSYPILTLFQAIPTHVSCLSVNLTASRKSYWTLNVL